MKTDDEVIAAYEAGDEHAFAELLDRYLDNVYSFALRLTGSKEEADDVAQETFLKAWKNLKRFPEGRETQDMAPRHRQEHGDRCPPQEEADVLQGFFTTGR